MMMCILCRPVSRAIIGKKPSRIRTRSPFANAADLANYPPMVIAPIPLPCCGARRWTACQSGVLTAWCRRQFGKLRGLRHTHASQLLGPGVNIKAVSSRLGHASAALTLSTYAHLLPGADQDAAQRIDDLLSGSKRVANQA